MWDKERNKHLFTTANLEKAQMIIDWHTDWNLTMALPKDIPTLEASSTKNLTHPDNVFLSHQLRNRITKFTAIPEQRAVNTDHFPILTVLDVDTERAPPQEGKES